MSKLLYVRVWMLVHINEQRMRNQNQFQRIHWATSFCPDHLGKPRTLVNCTNTHTRADIHTYPCQNIHSKWHWQNNFHGFVIKTTGIAAISLQMSKVVLVLMKDTIIIKVLFEQNDNVYRMHQQICHTVASEKSFVSNVISISICSMDSSTCPR